MVASAYPRKVCDGVNHRITEEGAGRGADEQVDDRILDDLAAGQRLLALVRFAPLLTLCRAAILVIIRFPVGICTIVRHLQTRQRRFPPRPIWMPPSLSASAIRAEYRQRFVAASIVICRLVQVSGGRSVVRSPRSCIRTARKAVTVKGQTLTGVRFYIYSPQFPKSTKARGSLSWGRSIARSRPTFFRPSDCTSQH